MKNWVSFLLLTLGLSTRWTINSCFSFFFLGGGVSFQKQPMYITHIWTYIRPSSYLTYGERLSQPFLFLPPFLLLDTLRHLTSPAVPWWWYGPLFSCLAAPLEDPFLVLFYLSISKCQMAPRQQLPPFFYVHLLSGLFSSHGLAHPHC